jgi:hypothetical protein
VNSRIYRPISILPALSKALELVMRDQIVSFCDRRGIISEFQSGFRPGHSMTTALLKVTGDISVELERKFFTILVLLDFSKAFDTISHNLLSQKFNFLFNLSDFAVRFVQLPRVFHGVLSFHFSSIYCSRYHIYADDLQIYLSGPMVDAELVLERINAVLLTISDWSLRNGLRLNSQKSRAMSICRKLLDYLLLPAVIIDHDGVGKQQNS